MATQIDSNDWNAEDNMWDIPADGGGSIPTPEAEDAGKVLTVNAGATGVEWATPSGGGGSNVNVVAATSISKTIDGHAFDSSTTPINVCDGPGSSVRYLSDQYMVADLDDTKLNFVSREAGGGLIGYAWCCGMQPLTALAPLSSTGFWLAEGQKYYRVYTGEPGNSNYIELGQRYVIPPDAEIVYVA